MPALHLPSLLQSVVIVFALYLVYSIYWELTTGVSRRRMIQERGCKPVNKLPDWDPILGLETFFQNIKWLNDRTLLDGSVSRFRSMSSNTFRFKVLGRPVCSTIEPDNLKTIQSLNFKDWSIGSQRIRMLTPFLGSGIFTTDGAAWQHSREMIRPNFVRSQVGDMDMFESHIADLLVAIPRDGTTVDLQDLFFRLTIDSATEFLFGESTNCLKPGLSTVSASKFTEAFNGAQEQITASNRGGKLSYFLVNQSVFKSRCKFVHEFVDGFVERGLARHAENKSDLNPDPGGRYVFINELVAQTSDKVQIRSELLNILLAGRDTTASLLSNAWFVLTNRPDIFAKLRAEISTLGGIKPSFEQIKELKYLRAFLNESLRLYPVVPGNSREAVVDTVLPMGGGKDGKSPMFVAKGAVVAWSVWAMHRRKDIYGEDAEEFRPERWMGEKGLRPGWEYLPFNGGPRICIGQQFALTEASYTTIRLLQEFSAIESRDPEPWREWLTLTCTGWGGNKVSLMPVE